MYILTKNDSWNSIKLCFTDSSRERIKSSYYRAILGIFIADDENNELNNPNKKRSDVTYVFDLD